MSFYEQYPQQKMKWNDKMVINSIIYMTPLVYILLLFMMYINNKENNSLAEVFKFGGISFSRIQYTGILLFIIYICSLFILVPILKKIFQRSAYLKQYGKKKEFKCEKVEEKIVISMIFYYFYIEGKEIIVKESKMSESTPLTGHSVEEGDMVPFAYNPEDFTDYIINYAD